MNTIFWAPIIEKYKTQSGKLNNAINYYLEFSETLTGGHTEKAILSTTDKISLYSDSSNRVKFRITQRTIDNDDAFIFLNIKNHTEKEHTLKFSLVFLQVDNFNARELSSFYRPPSFSNRYGENKLSTPSSYISTNKGSTVLSKAIFYHDNIMNYEDLTQSITKKLINETDPIKYSLRNGALHVNIEIKIPTGNNMDFFLLISEQSLFSSEDSFHSFFSDLGTSIENNDVRYNMWITAEGTYTKLPYSIEPFSPDGYGINLHHMSKKELMRHYKDKEDRFFYDLMYNAIIQFFGYRPSHRGLFLTNYTSTWLKKDYNIRAPYIDTRLNETLSLAIQDYLKFIDFPDLKNFHLNYADFLVVYSNSGQLLFVAEDAYFFPDYFALNNDAKITHSSLNHQLGILNYLLDKAKFTINEKYLIVAKSLIKAIERTCESWIKENNDLYYKIYLDESNNLAYSETDYVYVTLIDLFILQSNILEFFGRKNKSINKLILSKMKYLDSQCYGLNDENAKLPPNEDISSRKMAQKLALKLGYINKD
ncbi:hypothetical protein [Paenibacillus barengoltzii]|uniref:hypothetical protein n=1 Tax=Paenibacillus barengoltzii TaxID=343517 RepID=UPI000FD6CCDE|nr:hypothetical protein [Paenibacillus barengoltzii]